MTDEQVPVTGIGASFNRDSDSWSFYTMPRTVNLNLELKGYEGVDRIIGWLRAGLAAERRSAQPELTREERVNIGTVYAYEAGIEEGRRQAAQLDAGEVERLREALRPFAAIADEYDDGEDDRFEVWMDAGPIRAIRASFHLGLYRAARAALASAPATAAVSVGRERLFNIIRAWTSATEDEADKTAEHIAALLESKP